MGQCGVVVFCFASWLLLADLSSAQNSHLTDNVIGQLGQYDTPTVHSQLFSQILDRLDALDQRMSSLAERVESRVGDLGVKVEELLRQSGPGTSKVLQDLRAECAELSDDSSGETSRPDTGNRQEPDIPFRITRVSKTETEDAYTVRVEYEASTKPTVLLRRDYEMAFELQEEQELGVAEVEVPKASPDGDLSYAPTFLHFVFPDHFFTAQLELRNTPSTMDIPRFGLHVRQGTDVTFKPGQQVELDFTFTIEGDLDNVDYEHPRIQILVKSDTEDDVVVRHHLSMGGHFGFSQPSVWLDMVRNGGEKGNRHGTVLINSTRTDAEGVLDVYVTLGFNCSRNCLMKTLDNHTSIRFYREDHSGPFPVGFLAFVHDDFKQDSSRFYCDVNMPDKCFIYCEAYGSGLAAVELSRLTPSGDVEPTDDIDLLGGSWGFAQLPIHDVSFEDAGDFRCTARSATREITTVVSLDVVKAAKLDNELSTVTRLDNGSLSATCLAEGVPRPNVTFDTEYTNLGQLNASDYDVTMTRVDANSTRADLFISDPDVASKVYALDCKAVNVQYDFGRYNDHYTMYVNPSLYELDSV